MSDLESLERYYPEDRIETLEDVQYTPDQDYYSSFYSETVSDDPFAFCQTKRHDGSDQIYSKSDCEGNSTNLGSCSLHSPKAVFQIFTVNRSQCGSIVQQGNISHDNEENIPGLRYSSLRIGALTINERIAKLQRYRLKKQNRKHLKKHFVTRHSAAVGRLRHKGRFIKSNSSSSNPSCLNNTLSVKLPTKKNLRTNESVAYSEGPIFMITKMLI